MSPLNKLTAAPRIDARMAAYATLAGVALAAPSMVKADIIYSGPVNIVIPATTAGVYLNVATGVSNVSPTLAPGWDVNPYGSTNLTLFNPTTPTGGVYQGSASNFNLAPGTSVSSAGPFSNGLYGPVNLNSNNNYVGFRFQNETAANQIQYGWFQINFGATVTDRQIVGYAFENTGAPIAVGATAVPEPTTTALFGVMAAGALGLRAWRKRKAA
ncbi:MAG: PEP-CTERM sorting domain-containing protein [Verrucomicrobiota bacterium]|nr:PEP-CTERM sorting domain-containing protein [Verrucomicrobiota bacterium]